MNRLAYIAILLLSAILGRAQETRVSSQLSLGSLNQLDTYLSSEKHTGFQLGYISEVVRDSRKHPLTYTLTHEGALSKTRNRAANGSFLSGHYDFAYATMRRWDISQALGLNTSTLRLYAGGFVNANVGFCYNTKSAANNPAQAYLSANLGAQFMAAYTFTLWKKHFRLNYEACIPMLGLMFSPNYEQTYYEIFTQGNYDHNVVFTSIATFQIRQQLTLDIPVSNRTAIRIGYLGTIRQATPNSLKQHQWYNAAVIGITITK